MDPLSISSLPLLMGVQEILEISLICYTGKRLKKGMCREIDSSYVLPLALLNILVKILIDCKV